MDKYEKVMMEIYRDLYKNSTPSADFDELVANAEIIDGRKHIPFNDYLIGEKEMEEIISKHVKKFRKWERSRLRTSILLGCSPKTKYETI